MKNKTIKQKLVDVDLEWMKLGKSLKTKVQINKQGLEINFKGFGVATMDKGGGPVYIEVQNGFPVIYIWSDINSQDPTHMISLKGARLAAKAKTL